MKTIGLALTFALGFGAGFGVGVFASIAWAFWAAAN